ncbi:MAG: tRNA (adenosine(37)-N6)-threonylcarbamoyltransferase complex transferase subunit TsaD [Firmicutes bacterium]|nr:tRNA (adenosine(37)-N6)-threonylcarbamoyltransferase complex transferase subunit TsaD [Bacillota bacterium]
MLGIETSCDETSAAVVEDGSTIRSNVISSQVLMHQKFGGVVPEVASRHHVRLILPVLDQALNDAGATLQDISAVAVAYGPGLVGSLLVGISAAKSIAMACNAPLIGVNHVIGHIYANVLAHKDLTLPAVCLTVSGGHTDLLLIGEDHSHTVIGSTRDDAAGEAFDKVARVLGLGYPGGPHVDRVSREGNPSSVKFPRPMIEEDNFDFSFSGLKTAVINHIHTLRQRGESVPVADVAASFQQALVDVLTAKTIRAAEQERVSTVMLSGGVAANTKLRQELQRECDSRGIRLFYPPPVLCTDNAAMIACAGYYLWRSGHRADLSLNAVPGLTLGGADREKESPDTP